MIFYSLDAPEESSYKVTQILSHVSSSFEDGYILAGEDLSATLTADEDCTIANVTVIVGGEDVTSASYSAGTVTVNDVDGEVVIIATATQGA